MYVPSTFFEEQLTAFEVWLTQGSELRAPPEQLPIVLQVELERFQNKQHNKFKKSLFSATKCHLALKQLYDSKASFSSVDFILYSFRFCYLKPIDYELCTCLVGSLTLDPGRSTSFSQSGFIPMSLNYFRQTLGWFSRQETTRLKVYINFDSYF